MLYLALEYLLNGHTYEAKRELLTARQLLDEYLAADNMIRDDDVEDGFIRALDTFDEEQMVFIRDFFAERLESIYLRPSTQQYYLDLINVVQRATGCDEYEDLNDFRLRLNGSFA